MAGTTEQKPKITSTVCGGARDEYINVEVRVVIEFFFFFFSHWFTITKEKNLQGLTEKEEEEKKRV